MCFRCKTLKLYRVKQLLFDKQRSEVYLRVFRHLWQVTPASHLPKIKTVTPTQVEVDSFILNNVTEARLNQGIEFLEERDLPLTRQSLGSFLKWLVNNVLTEEGGDLSSVVEKEARKQISKRGSIWFSEYVGTNK